MALPTILINSATGSDTQASGAGPATALFGTTDASFAGAVVTLTASTDLSGVAVDGSHVLYLLTSTGVRFFKITAKDDGADTVTVTPSPAGTSTGRTWAIGGKRASIGSASSELLFDNAAAAGDAMPGWIVEMEPGHTESISAPIDMRRAGDTTSGAIVFRGTPGAATLPKITATSAINMIVNRGNYQTISGVELTAGAANMTSAITSVAAAIIITGVKLSRTSTNTFTAGLAVTSGNTIKHCEVQRCVTGIVAGDANTILFNYIHDCSSHGINLGVNSLGGKVHGNIIYACGGDGVTWAFTGNSSRSGSITHNTIDSCTGDGIEISGAALDGFANLLILNNVLSNNGAYGLNFSDASITDAALNAYGTTVSGNQTYLNTSGAYRSNTGTYAYNACPWATDDTGLNPAYTDAASGNFAIGTNLKAKATPVGGTRYVGSTSTTYSYSDPGAAQREEPASGGGLLTHPGYSGRT